MAISKLGDTRNTIVDKFIKMVEEMGASDVTVVSLTDSLEISRKTFYYYFNDLDSLLIFIFRRDLAKILEENYARKFLVFEEEGSPYAEYSYYARVVTKGKLMTQTQFFWCLAECFDNRNKFYATFFKDRRRGGFSDYLYNLYRQALREDASFILEEKHLPDSALSFISDWITGAFLERFSKRLMGSDPFRSVEEIAPFGNIQHEILYMYHLCEYDAENARLIFPFDQTDSPTTM